jgi:alpha-L-glutamate ligase-like protein
MFSLVRALKRRGVLAINRRNADYILRYNPRRLYPLVDDKWQTKQLAIENGIAVPELYAIVEIQGQVRELPRLLQHRQDFVIKPARGSGGEGILVVERGPNGKFRKSDGLLIDQEEVDHHIYNVLSGLYSLGGQPDKALIEYRVIFHSLFEAVSYQGVPDIRIVVFLGVPVMAMVRLPTRQSDGKANLHQGAIGAGIDMGTGRTLHGVLGNEMVEEHPDTGNRVSGIMIPHWEELLCLAARCYELTGLGYLGVDIVMDRDKGPLLLELNARPGLNIQIANNAGLLLRLNQVEQRHHELQDPEARVTFCQDHFRVRA